MNEHQLTVTFPTKLCGASCNQGFYMSRFFSTRVLQSNFLGKYLLFVHTSSRSLKTHVSCIKISGRIVRTLYLNAVYRLSLYNHITGTHDMPQVLVSSYINSVYFLFLSHTYSLSSFV